MPLYEFTCQTCGHEFEEFMSYKKSNSVTCPICNNPALRLISLPGAIVCDGNFSLTGKVDRRLGGYPIAGRKDYHKRVKEKGFRELSSSELKDLRDDDSEREVPAINF